MFGCLSTDFLLLFSREPTFGRWILLLPVARAPVCAAALWAVLITFSPTLTPFHRAAVQGLRVSASFVPAPCTCPTVVAWRLSQAPSSTAAHHQPPPSPRLPGTSRPQSLSGCLLPQTCCPRPLKSPAVFQEPSCQIPSFPADPAPCLS